MLTATLLYAPSVANPLIWDDELHVPLATSTGAREAFGTAAGDYRRPLVLLSYAAQARLGLASPAALHAANAVLHGLNAALVVFVVGALLPASLAAGEAALVALAAALVFAGHPLATGSVAYVSGRTDLLATLFLLLAVAACARGGVRPARDSSPGLSTALAVASVVAAALSKESGLMAGPIAAAVLWWRRSGGDRNVTAFHVAAPLVAASAAAAFVLPAAAGVAAPLGLRLRGAGTALATYGGLLVWPHDLHLDRLTPLGPPAAATALGAAALVAAAAIVVRFARSPSRPLLAAVALAMLLAPGIGFVPVYPAIADRYVFTGEQFLYAPMIVLAAVFAFVSARFIEALLPRLAPAAALDRLRQRLATPRDGAAAGPSVAAPGAFGAMLLAMTLALAWMPGVLDRQVEFSSAASVYRRTLAHSPSPRACFNLGNLHLERREYGEALAVYEHCVGLAPADAAAHGQLAIALQQLGRTEEARREYGRSVALDDGNARVWSNFATLDANAGRYADARVKWKKALAVDPAEPTALEALRRLDRAGR